ncbi:vanomycin resistance protein VanB [Priestia megaterium]|nr:vanomycin resistance protein VanB [Priestia megaterium]
MKKVLGTLLLGATLVSGYIAYDMYTDHTAKQAAAIEAKTVKKVEQKKEPVIKVDDLTYQLKDSRTGQVMREFQPVHFSDKKVYEQEIKKLADELAKSVDTPMQSMKLDANGALVGGANRIILKEDEFIQNLKNLTTKNLEVNVPIYETAPNLSVETIQGVNEIAIASYTTKFRPSDRGRNRNIQLSAQAINNTVLGPGDYFSYNSVVGPRTAERGYQQAPEIINKELVMGIGGGICQTSSTLFNAVDQMSLQIVARSHHSKDVGYVPAGRDATVSWNGPDFKFMNNKPYPVIIKAYANLAGGTLTVEVRTAQRYL